MNSSSFSSLEENLEGIPMGIPINNLEKNAIFSKLAYSLRILCQGQIQFGLYLLGAYYKSNLKN